MLTTIQSQRYAKWHAEIARALEAEWAKIVNPPEGTPIYEGVPCLDVRFHEHEGWQWDEYIRYGYEGGRRHVRALAPRFAKVVHPNKALETANEPKCNSGAELVALNAYLMGAMDEGVTLGIPIIIGNIPEGNPAADPGLTGEAARGSERWKLEQLAPAVRQCVLQGHFLGWHGYWHPQVEGPEGRWHALGRIAWTITQFLNMGVPPSLRVLVTEFGIDGLIRQKLEGWQVLSTPEAYRAEIVRAEAYARTIPQIRALCYFTYGWEAPWETYDHPEGFARSLVAPLRALAGPSNPVTTPTPTVPYLPEYVEAGLTDIWDILDKDTWWSEEGRRARERGDVVRADAIELSRLKWLADCRARLRKSG